MKIGIFGGSFNPPHHMHKSIALKLIESGYVDEVIYVPTGDMYNKKDLISFSHRLNMLNLMIENNSNIKVSNIGNSIHHQYTYQVLDYFKGIYKDACIYFICGTDNLRDFSTWKNYEYILKNYKLLVIKRNNDDIRKLLNKYDRYRENITIADVNPQILSSTYLRSNINSCDINEYLDENVLNYIKNNNLYIR